MQSFKEDYSKYTVSDFMMNDDFKQWVKSSDNEVNDYWKRVQENFPEKAADIKIAVKLIKLLSIQQEAKHDTAKAKIWQEIEKKINEVPQDTNVRTLGVWKSFRRIAAILVPILLIGGAWLYWGFLKPVKITTAYGEVKTVILPDQSVVKMNGNSSVRYAGNWGKDAPREIWLEGEAFFEVQHINKNDKKVSQYERFIVHSGPVNVEVLGTSFNIRNRRGRTDVVLAKGKIKVDLDQKSNAAVYLKPADKFVYDQQLNLIRRSVTNTDVATSWKTGKLQLTDATVNEVINYIEDNYGYQIHLSNQNMGKKQLEGVIFLDNLDDMLFALSTMLNVEVIKDGKKIELRERPQ